MRPDELSHDQRVAKGRVKRLVTPSLASIEDVFANDPPVLQFEGIMPKNLIGMGEAIEYESNADVSTLSPPNPHDQDNRTWAILMSETFPVCGRARLSISVNKQEVIA